MKDYYYFLGVLPEASPEEIKAAYRKLSHKYHPDKNSADAFFIQRFSDLKQAYDVLIDPESRKLYDKGLELVQRRERSQLPPVIRSFTSSQLKVDQFGKVIVKWNTENADVVKLLPFGLVKPFGEKTIEVTEFQNGKFQLLLHAQNTLLRKTVVSSLVIYDKSHVSDQDAQELHSSRLSRSRVKPKVSKEKEGFQPVVVAVVVLALILLLIFILK